MNKPLTWMLALINTKNSIKSQDNKYYNPFTITVNGYTKDNINSTYKNKSLAEQVASQRPKK